MKHHFVLFSLELNEREKRDREKHRIFEGLGSFSSKSLHIAEWMIFSLRSLAASFIRLWRDHAV
jgi:hypothetical protein